MKEVDFRQRNTQIANALRQGVNPEDNVWKEQVKDVLLKVFQELKRRVEESGIIIKQGTATNSRQSAENRQYLYQFNWSYGDPLNTGHEMRFRVEFNENLKTVDLWKERMWWGIYWDGGIKGANKTKVSNFLQMLIDKSNPNYSIIQDELIAFNGVSVSLMMQNYTPEQLDSLDHDIIDEIFEDIKKITPNMNEKIKLITPDQKAVIQLTPSKEHISPFNQKAFDLLLGLHENPTRDYYNNNKSDLKEYLEKPFQDVFQKVANKFGDKITSKLETSKKLFSRILKNDYGKGGAWDFYWGAFHPKGGYRVEDAQLFATINYEMFEFGFYIGEYGPEQSKRFLTNCHNNQTVLQKILKDSFSDPELIFGQWDKQLEDGKLPETLWDVKWQEWLARPGEKGIHVCKIFLKDDLLAIEQDKFIEEIHNTFSKLFPLVLLTMHEDPIPEIKEYLDIDIETKGLQPSYTLLECANNTGIEKEQLESWIRAIERKGQAILYGPPGTGKTYLAEHLARHLISEGDGFYEIVQFHPAYAYEDFIQGIRPRAKDNGQLDYPVVSGRFLEFCKKARKSENICVLIIDEINRANLSRVFGELMYLLEYRDKELPLSSGGLLGIPKNVRIIGTMNTADRSIALVDHALRRRFAFLALYPNYEILKKYHSKTGFNVDPLITILKKLNQQIRDKHYEIGITFFLVKDLDKQIQDIWLMEIEPYLEEYFFDPHDHNKVESFCWEKVKETLNGNH
jgi:5-methylcytosine-specific restriction enzyme B